MTFSIFVTFFAEIRHFSSIVWFLRGFSNLPPLKRFYGFNFDFFTFCNRLLNSASRLLYYRLFLTLSTWILMGGFSVFVLKEISKFQLKNRHIHRNIWKLFVSFSAFKHFLGTTLVATLFFLNPLLSFNKIDFSLSCDELLKTSWLDKTCHVWFLSTYNF